METTELYVVLLCALPIATAVAAVSAQRNRLGLLHIWLVLVALSYGAYTIADVLVNGTAGVEWFAVTILMFSVTASMIVTIIAFNSMSPQVRYYFSVENLIRETDRTSFLSFYFAWMLVIAWHIYLYSTYGLLAHLTQDTASAPLWYGIPSWIGPVNQFMVAVGFGVFIWLVARTARKGDHELFALSLFMLLVMIMLLSLNGRRVFVSLVVLGAMVVLVRRGQLAFMYSFRNVFLGAATFALVVIFSNIFQSFRQAYMAGGLAAGQLTDFDPVDAMLNIAATTSNLAARTALWRFHYSIVIEQLNDLFDVLGGTLLWSGLLGAVPRMLYPEKAVIPGDDVLVCQHYALICPDYSFADIDYPQTLFSGAQADFGFLFIVLAPIFILVVIRLVGYYGLLSRRGTISPVLYILVFGAAAELLVNVEQGYGSYFIWARDIAMLTFIVGIPGFLSGISSER